VFTLVNFSNKSRDIVFLLIFVQA